MRLGSRFLSNVVSGVFSGLIAAAVIGLAALTYNYLAEKPVIERIGGVTREEFKNENDKVYRDYRRIQRALRHLERKIEE